MLIRILCVTGQQEKFAYFPPICWAKSGLFRWTFIDLNEDVDPLTLNEANRIIIDWSPDHKLAQNLWTKISEELPSAAPKVLHFADTPDVRVFPRRENTQVLVRPQLEEEVGKWIDAAKQLPRPKIDWRKDNPYFQEIESVMAQIDLVVEKYFPETTSGHVMVGLVPGGRSGTPIVRLTVPGHSSPYALKFFRKIEEFKREWQAHESALSWLGKAGVPLHPVPEVAQEAQAQAEVFPDPDAKRSPNFPICYRWSDVTGHLEELYQKSTPDSFAENAYRTILQALKDNQDTKDSPVDPQTLPFVGPVPEDAPPVETCYKALTGSTYQRWFRTAQDEFREKGPKFFGGKRAWKEGISSISNTLDSTPPEWLKSPVEVRCGQIHGDPNSRNILFHFHAPKPSDLRFIDLGRFRADAPLVVDLVFLESDIKFALMATEAGRKDYWDWETKKLATWRKVEEEAIKGGLDYVPPARTLSSDPSIAKAYTIISDIRRRAKEVSPRDSVGRAYFLYLLFWSLRQIRSWSLPPTKRLLALYSASQICQHLESWRNP